MKKSIKQKKGISLIVLVITIVVMIILASAIILSLRSSSIIGRANEAVEKSDIANAKNVVSLAYAEWSLNEEELSDEYATFSEYANYKLDEAGFDTTNIYATDEGELITGTAAFFLANNVAIGTEVTGYVLSTATDAKTYTTIGDENTCDADNNTETDPISATYTRDESITWTYIGIDYNGEALIVGSVTSATPKITLGGKGGYLNGPATLDAICNTMYSSNMGKARSMDIDDVTRVLEYKGEKGSYYSTSGSYTPTEEPLTIGEIATLLETTVSWTTTDGEDVNTYKANYYYISKTEDTSEYNTDMQNLIYPLSTNTTLSVAYWLASSCIQVDFSAGNVDFYGRYCNSLRIDADILFSLSGGCGYSTYAIRPVVELADDIQVSYSNGVVTLSK